MLAFRLIDSPYGMIHGTSTVASFACWGQNFHSIDHTHTRPLQQITMTKLSKRISALLRRKAKESTTDVPAPAETAAKVSYAEEILVDCDRDFCAFASSANNSTHTPNTLATKAETIIPTSNMVSADASGFVERAFGSASSAAFPRDEPAAIQTVVGSSLPVHHLNSPTTQSHTLFPSSSFPDPMMKMEWSVFGAADSSTVVAATHVVKSDDENDIDVFLSFVFKATAVDAIIQYLSLIHI